MYHVKTSNMATKRCSAVSANPSTAPSCFPTSVIQVRFLEQQSKMLETKLELLQGQGVARSNVEPLFEAYMAGLRRQMDLVNNDKTKLDGELRNMQGLVEDYKHK